MASSRPKASGKLNAELEDLVKRGLDRKMVKKHSVELNALLKTGWDPSILDEAIRRGNKPTAYTSGFHGGVGMFTYAQEEKISKSVFAKAADFVKAPFKKIFGKKNVPVAAVAATPTKSKAAAIVESTAKKGWGKGTKWGIGIAVAVGAVLTLGLLSRGKKEQASDDAFVAPVQTPTSDALLNAPLPQENEPAADYAANQWQQTIAAQRGQAPKDMGPVNPKMNVVPESSVQVLGSPPVVGR